VLLRPCDALGAPISVIFAFTVWQNLLKFGGIGLVVLGALDASPIPIPGSIDALTIFLSATNRDRWLYYAIMALIGSEIGGAISYELAKRAGEEAIHKKIGAQRAKRLRELIDKWGFGAVAVPAMMPPPFPLTPFLLFAGATEYPRKKFLLALAVGRAVKYPLLAYLASVYGRRFLAREIRHFEPFLVAALIVLGVGGIAFLIGWAYLRTQPGHTPVKEYSVKH
jgi:membrane protein YqaA with SNARE-associated domain